MQGWCKARLKWLSPSCWIGLEPASKSYVGSLQKLSTNTTICTTSVEYSSIRLFSAGKIKENFSFWWDSRQLKRYLVGNAEKWIAIDWLWWTRELLAIQLTTRGALAEEDTELQMTNVLIMETMIHSSPPFLADFPAVFFWLGHGTNDNPSTDKLSRVINYPFPGNSWKKTFFVRNPSMCWWWQLWWIKVVVMVTALEVMVKADHFQHPQSANSK